ncbi:uncharacterized protein LOC135387973 isoform X2 [Ornithodoros turicata]|uniref:uncharacterized protein LOC135387973 isoform X2 n=1 Tax=Ornithodoros turicata TaxID=34597 RepID=UPI003138BDE4
MAKRKSEDRRRSRGINCRARGCNNSSVNCSLSFFGFPGDDRRSAWIEYSGRPEYAALSLRELKNRKLCEVHFASNSFANRQRTHLKKTAVPTVPLRAVRSSASMTAGHSVHTEGPLSTAPLAFPHATGGRPQDATGCSMHTEGPLSTTPLAFPHATGVRPQDTTGHSVHMELSPSTRLASPLYHMDPQEGTGNSPGEVACIQTSTAASVSSTHTATPSPHSDPHDLSPLAVPLEPSDTDLGTHQPEGSVSAAERPGRPQKKRTPRTASLIYRLQTTRERLRRSLFRSRVTRHFGGLTKGQIVHGASRYLSKRALDLFRAQLCLQPLQKFGRRWPPHFRSFALNLHFKGPQAYRYLSEVLALPSESSLRNWLKEVTLEPGVMPSVLEGLKTKLQGLPPKDRTCVLLFDEMSIKEHLQYDSRSDTVYGFADTGKERNSQMANSALLVALSGLTKAWVQPLCYLFSKSTVSADTLQDLIQDLIRQLKSLDISVKAVVCDQGASNCALSRKLQISPTKPYFCVDESKVYFIFDPPHLMKTTRNLLLKHDLQIGDAQEKVQWSFIKQYYESDHPLKVRLSPKLTDNHIHPTAFKRMKVKLATQVLSNSVSTGIAVLISVGCMPPAATETSEFLLKMDQLFDCLNSSSVEQSDDKKMRYAMNNSTKHKELLESAAQWIATWKFDSDRQPPTVRGWQITIRAVLALWEDLHQNFGFEHLLTRRLNQDPLENMFGQFRQMHGCNETPNAFQFVSSLKHTLAGRLMKLPSRGNCEADTTELLNDLLSMPVSSTADIPCEPDSSQGMPADDEMETEHEMHVVQEPDNIIEANAQYAYAGSLVHSFLKNSKCTDCPSLLRAAGEGIRRAEGLYLYLESESGGSDTTSCAPSDSFFAYFGRLENVFKLEISNVLHRQQVRKQLVNRLRHCHGRDTLTSHEPFCSIACQGSFLGHFVNKRLQYHIRLKNREAKEAAFQRSEQRKRKKLPA